MNAADVAMRCISAREQGDGWQCTCPAHDDTHASLSVQDGERGVVLYCHAGCEFSNILSALGLSPAEVFVNSAHAGTSSRRRIVATYDYTDAHGTLLYQAVRYEPKEFRQRRPHPEYIDEWIYDLKGVSRVLYRLPELLTTEQPVYVVEGEKDVERLRQLGYVATTAAMGARARWPADYIAMWVEGLRGKEVILLPDNDEPGQQHMAQALRHLKEVARSIRLVCLPGLPDKGDVSDWLQTHSPEDFASYLAHAPDTPIPASSSAKRAPKILSPQGQINTRYNNGLKHPENDPERWRAGLLLDSDGEPTENVGNIMLLLAFLPEAESLWWDSFALRVMWGEAPLSDADHIRIAALLTQRFSVPINRLGNLAKCIHAIAQSRSRDPLYEYVSKLAWDGQERLAIWTATYLRAEDTPLNSWIGKTLCCALVARALTPGCQQRYVVIFEGPEEAGKSKACNILGGAWYDAITSNFDAKEAIINLRGCWVVEVEELNAMRKSEDAAVKAFVTRIQDRITLKYANEPTTYPRRTVLIGTVNPSAEGYLRGLNPADDTRYLPIAVGVVDAEGLALTRDQLFAEARALLDAGYAWWKAPEDVSQSLITEREERREGNIYDKVVSEWLRNTVEHDSLDYVTLQEVMVKALGIEEKERWAHRPLQMQVAQAIRLAGWTRILRRKGKEVFRAWIPPVPF